MVRSSLGNAALTSTKARYPMYVIPVKALLELDAWEPHQALLAQGMLVEVTSEVDLEIVFVSHQWTSFDHPDPKGEQLARLQAVLRELMAGQTDVQSNEYLQAIYATADTTTGAQWAVRRQPHKPVTARLPRKKFQRKSRVRERCADLRRRANRDSLLRLPEYGLARRRREQEVHA